MYETTFLKHSSGSVVRSNSFSTTFASTDDVAFLALRGGHWDALRAVASELVDVLGAVAVRHSCMLPYFSLICTVLGFRI